MFLARKSVNCAIVMLWLLIPLFSFAQETETHNDEQSAVEQITESYFRIGSVYLDKAKREVYIKGKVNMIDGMIELLACGKRGKMHESILVLDAIPHDIQVALLLLGLDSENVKYNADSTQVIDGDNIEISVLWNDGKKKVSASELFKNIETGKPPEAKWVFIGSKVIDGLFVADQEESIIATYHDEYSIIDFAATGADNDELFVINKDLVPPIGTAVEVILKATL